MAKGLNKHTPDSDELLKRLETHDSSGLDDFEKEALEGFDSLDNVELAKDLNASLNKKLDEKYFQKEGGNKKGMMYLSLAAGLVLIVGLSIFFMNIMGDKKEMAMQSAPDTEKIANEVSKPSDLAPTPAPAELGEVPKAEGKKASGAGGEVPVTTAYSLSESEEKFVSKDAQITTGEQKPDNDDGLTSRMVVKEKKTETAKEPNKSADAESGDDLKNLESDKAAKGPPAGNNTPASPAIVVEDQKAKPVQTTKAQEEVATEKIALSKNNSNNNNLSRSDSKSGKDANKQAPEKKEKRKDQKSEALGNEDVVVTVDENSIQKQTSINQSVAVGGVASGTKRDESGYHNAEFANRAYNKPQDYIKNEIDKSEMLKTNVKAFKADLTINDKGLVTAVKFLTPFDNCTGCKKELEKILLNMPGWKAATKGEKTVTETVSFIYP